MGKVLRRLAIPIIGGAIVGKLTTSHAKEDYENFIKPPYAAPKEAFGIVWPLLYTVMGISYNIVKRQRKTASSTGLHYLQLGLNYLWSLLYFKVKLRGTALIESYMLLVAVILTVHNFYQKNKFAGIILLPYVVWSSYATYLNAGNWLLNRDNPEYSNE